MAHNHVTKADASESESPASVRAEFFLGDSLAAPAATFHANITTGTRGTGASFPPATQLPEWTSVSLAPFDALAVRSSPSAAPTIPPRILVPRRIRPVRRHSCTDVKTFIQRNNLTAAMLADPTTFATPADSSSPQETSYSAPSVNARVSEALAVE